MKLPFSLPARSISRATIFAALAAGSISIAGVATAKASGPYVNVGGGVAAIKASPDGPSFTGTDITARVGYNFGRYFAVEIEGALALSGEESQMSAATSGAATPEGPVLVERFEDTSYSNQYGFFLRGRLPVSDRAEIFARAGLGVRELDLRVETRFDGVTDSIFDGDDSDGYAAIGLGVQYTLDDNLRNALRIDVVSRGFARTIEDEGTDTYGEIAGTVAYVRKF